MGNRGNKTDRLRKGLVVLMAMGWMASGGTVVVSAQEQPSLTIPAKWRQKWDQLSPGQKKRYKERLRRWRAMSPEEKARMRRNLHKFQKLSPKEKQFIRRNWARFKRLPPYKQRVIRKKYQRWRRMPPEKRRRIKQRWEKFRRLPPEKRKEMRRRWQKQRGRSLDRRRGKDVYKWKNRRGLRRMPSASWRKERLKAPVHKGRGRTVNIRRHPRR